MKCRLGMPSSAESSSSAAWCSRRASRRLSPRPSRRRRNSEPLARTPICAICFRHDENEAMTGKSGSPTAAAQGEAAKPRGYFGLGVEGISKPMNLGAVLRTAHAFNASFAFAIGATFDVAAVLASDTSVAFNSLPLQLYDNVAAFTLPLGCRLIGIEITADAIDLP